MMFLVLWVGSRDWLAALAWRFAALASSHSSNRIGVCFFLPTVHCLRWILLPCGVDVGRRRRVRSRVQMPRWG